MNNEFTDLSLGFLQELILHEESISCLLEDESLFYNGFKYTSRTHSKFMAHKDNFNLYAKAVKKYLQSPSEGLLNLLHSMEDQLKNIDEEYGFDVDFNDFLESMNLCSLSIESTSHNCFTDFTNFMHKFKNDIYIRNYFIYELDTYDDILYQNGYLAGEISSTTELFDTFNPDVISMLYNSEYYYINYLIVKVHSQDIDNFLNKYINYEYKINQFLDAFESFYEYLSPQTATFGTPIIVENKENKLKPKFHIEFPLIIPCEEEPRISLETYNLFKREHDKFISFLAKN